MGQSSGWVLGICLVAVLWNLGVFKERKSARKQRHKLDKQEQGLIIAEQQGKWFKEMGGHIEKRMNEMEKKLEKQIKEMDNKLEQRIKEMDRNIEKRMNENLEQWMIDMMAKVLPPVVQFEPEFELDPSLEFSLDNEWETMPVASEQDVEKAIETDTLPENVAQLSKLRLKWLNEVCDLYEQSMPYLEQIKVDYLERKQQIIPENTVYDETSSEFMKWSIQREAALTLLKHNHDDWLHRLTLPASNILREFDQLDVMLKHYKLGDRPVEALEQRLDTFEKYILNELPFWIEETFGNISGKTDVNDEMCKLLSTKRELILNGLGLPYDSWYHRPEFWDLFKTGGHDPNFLKKKREFNEIEAKLNKFNSPKMANIHFEVLASLTSELNQLLEQIKLVKQKL